MKNCIIITSVVQTTNKPLNYSETRSIYSHQQRFEQTLETIESVRKYIANVHILLIECSPPSEWMEQLKSKVDQFINLEFNETVNNSLEKGLGEKTLLLHALSSLTEEYAYIYKITGIKENMTYSIIKGGIISLTRQMASYYGKYNIRINNLCAGGVFDYQNKTFVNNYSKKTGIYSESYGRNNSKSRKYKKGTFLPWALLLYS
jgi:NAD(P)-dependent dehydrogenase (short-subunit alcohol dehydrogenase family)